MIAIAGATGFVGRALGAALRTEEKVIGLARHPPRATVEGFSLWRRADFLSLLDAEQALEGVSVAFYLIHSMMPAARLTQGKFQDFDLIAADNFARSAKKNGLKQIIYLGGLIPEEKNLSPHLKSRLEVEEALGAYGTPVTTLRAGMIVGPGGSSFVIVKRLVERLPIMVCPRWTRTETQPIALNDVVSLLQFCIGKAELYSQHFDIGGPDILTYEKMMHKIAEQKGRHLRVFRIPFFTPGLSRLWLSLITGAPRSLVRPLIQSLRHRMLAKDRRLQEIAKLPGLSFSEGLNKAFKKDERGLSPKPVAFVGNRGKQELDVASVQRFPGPKTANAAWIAHEYLRWLPRLFPFFLRVKVSEEKVCRFSLWPLRLPLLILEYSRERSSDDRALFYIRGGLLARIQGRGRLEMREVLNRKFLLVALLDFRPRLPWFVYKYSQAYLHRLVMWRFGHHLLKTEAK